MKIIAGDFKGRNLITPRGANVRPTASRVREAIFSMVQPYMEGAVCLDLFAGSGALGIEALSRGAARVYFCDIASDSIHVLKQNLDLCRASGPRAVVLHADWKNAIISVREKCNLIFIDAPYEMCEHYSQMLKELEERQLLAEDAVVLIERSADKNEYMLPDSFQRIRKKRYGGIGVDLLEYYDQG